MPWAGSALRVAGWPLDRPPPGRTLAAMADPAPAATVSADAWVDAHAEALFRFALTRLRRRQDAEDAVQEALLAAIQARRDFRGDSSERTWLIGILRHKIVDRIRLLAREDACADAADAADAAWWKADGHWAGPVRAWRPAASADEPAELAERREFWQQVRRCLGTLPERQAQVFILRTMDGVEAEEVCRQTGISAANLWVLLHRARTRLRDCLGSSWFAQDFQP